MKNKISIIIPFKDKPELLKQCIFSILKKNAFENYEILLVDNQSVEKSTRNFLKEIKSLKRIKVLRYNKAFNFSAINNFAVKKATGDYVLFLNNDTKAISSNWLKEMLKCFDVQKIGIVGARLLYPDKTIQHCGVMLEKERLAIHAFRKWKEKDVEMVARKEWSAVTGACMMTKRSLFLKAGGFDEVNLPIAYNDIDYCLRVRRLGFKIICATDVKLYHYESISRKSDMLAKFLNRSRYKKFIAEQEYMRNEWKGEIEDDCFYESNFI